MTKSSHFSTETFLCAIIDSDLKVNNIYKKNGSCNLISILSFTSTKQKYVFIFPKHNIKIKQKQTILAQTLDSFIHIVLNKTSNKYPTAL